MQKSVCLFGIRCDTMGEKRKGDTKMTEQKIKDFITRYSWTFSKTYAKFAPHEYYVKDNLDEQGKEDFVEFVIFIREVGFPCKFGKQTHIYFEFEGKYYWTMGDTIPNTIILNRCNVEDYVVLDGKMFYKRGRHDLFGEQRF